MKLWPCAIVLALTAACGSSASPRAKLVSPPPSYTSDAALDRWADYPVDQSPRRPVIGTDVVKVGDPVSKSSSFFGTLVPPASFPTAPAEVDGYPIISAQVAYDAYARSINPVPHPPSDYKRQVAAPTLGSAKVLTDRGDQVLPVWVFPAESGSGRNVLALSTDAFEASASSFEADETVEAVPSTATTLHVTFPAYPCDKPLMPAALESRTAVEIHLVPLTKGSYICTEIDGPSDGSSTSYSSGVAQLSAPIGNRVVIDEMGTLIPVVRPRPPLPSPSR